MAYTLCPKKAGGVLGVCILKYTKGNTLIVTPLDHLTQKLAKTAARVPFLQV
jgi:hypothetical protein